MTTEVCRRLDVANYEVCIQFVSPRTMRQLNRDYRGKDKSTDVLAFPQYSWKRPLKCKKSPPALRPIANPQPLGDVVISPADASANINGISNKLQREICFLIVHGILHLVGHDHMTARDRKRMFAEQTKLMRLFRSKAGTPPSWEGCIKPMPSANKKVTNLKTKHPPKRKIQQKKG